MALFIGIAAGAISAVIVGLPAVRIQGLYLAVTTLAFGYAIQTYILNPNYFLGRFLLPHGQAASIIRPTLYGRIDPENQKFFDLTGLLHVVDRGRAGLPAQSQPARAHAMRDNQRAMASSRSSC